MFYYLSQHHELELSSQKEIHYYNYHRFNGKDLNWYKSFFPLRGTAKKSGEASPYYLFDPRVPEQLKQDIPNVKLIALLRNPIDRAYSAYSMNARRVSGSFPSFEQAIANQDMSQEASRLYLWRGLYAQHIESWLRYFARDQFLFIKAEEFFMDPKTVLRDVYHFLDISEVFPHNLRAQEVGEYAELQPQLRGELEDFFSAPNRTLADLLGPRFSW